MIIETPYKEGDTITMKTTAGEEIIARLESQSGDKLKVSKPMVLTATQSGIGMVPYSFTVGPNTKIEIRAEALVFVAKTDEDSAKQYIESTTNIKLSQLGNSGECK